MTISALIGNYLKISLALTAPAQPLANYLTCLSHVSSLLFMWRLSAQFPLVSKVKFLHKSPAWWGLLHALELFGTFYNVRIENFFSSLANSSKVRRISIPGHTKGALAKVSFCFQSVISPLMLVLITWESNQQPTKFLLRLPLSKILCM